MSCKTSSEILLLIFFVAFENCYSLLPVSHEKVDEVYGREGTDVLLQCSSLTPEIDIRPPSFSWTLKGLTAMSTVVERPNGDLEIDDLKIENSGYYKCTITNKDDDGNVQERTFTHKLIVYKIPNHFLHSGFSVRIKALNCGPFTKMAVENQASAAFCPPGEFLVCPFTFESSCQATKDPKFRIVQTKIVQRLDLEFKLPECDPACVYDAITKRMQHVYEVGRARFSKDFLSGPVVPPDTLDEFSTFVYLHSVKNLPMIKWEARSQDHTIIKCPPGFRSDPDPPVCIPCTPGLFSLQGIRCTKCPIDTYQDGYAKDSCKACPLGTSSKGMVGLQTENQCIGKSDATETVKQSLRHQRNSGHKGKIVASQPARRISSYGGNLKRQEGRRKRRSLDGKSKRDKKVQMKTNDASKFKGNTKDKLHQGKRSFSERKKQLSKRRHQKKKRKAVQSEYTEYDKDLDRKKRHYGRHKKSKAKYRRGSHSSKKKKLSHILSAVDRKLKKVDPAVKSRLKDAGVAKTVVIQNSKLAGTGSHNKYHARRSANHIKGSSGQNTKQRRKSGKAINKRNQAANVWNPYNHAAQSPGYSLEQPFNSYQQPLSRNRYSGPAHGHPFLQQQAEHHYAPNFYQSPASMQNFVQAGQYQPNPYALNNGINSNMMNRYKRSRTRRQVYDKPIVRENAAEELRKGTMVFNDKFDKPKDFRSIQMSVDGSSIKMNRSLDKMNDVSVAVKGIDSDDPLQNKTQKAEDAKVNSSNKLVSDPNDYASNFAFQLDFTEKLLDDSVDNDDDFYILMKEFILGNDFPKQSVFILGEDYVSEPPIVQVAKGINLNKGLKTQEKGSDFSDNSDSAAFYFTEADPELPESEKLYFKKMGLSSRELVFLGISAITASLLCSMSIVLLCVVLRSQNSAEVKTTPKTKPAHGNGLKLENVREAGDGSACCVDIPQVHQLQAKV